MARTLALKMGKYMYEANKAREGVGGGGGGGQWWKNIFFWQMRRVGRRQNISLLGWGSA